MKDFITAIVRPCGDGAQTHTVIDMIPRINLSDKDAEYHKVQARA